MHRTMVGIISCHRRVKIRSHKLVSFDWSKIFLFLDFRGIEPFCLASFSRFRRPKCLHPFAIDCFLLHRKWLRSGNCTKNLFVPLVYWYVLWNTVYYGYSLRLRDSLHSKRSEPNSMSTSQRQTQQSTDRVENLSPESKN
mgnify:CR=1 FL=1